MTDINVGAITEALNDKMDRNANNIESPKLPIFLVAVQYPTAENNYTWYRKYSDGWVEQGSSNAVATGTTVNLPITMADSNYIANSTIVSYTGTSAMGADIRCITRTTTTIKLGNYVNFQGITVIWEVKGMAAS